MTVFHCCLGSLEMGALALMMFITLFAFGQKFIGWTDPHGKVQLSIFATFLFGIICGWTTRGPK